MVSVMLKKTLLILAITIITISLWPEKKGKTCSHTNDREVTSIIKMDFIERLPNWKNDAELIGTLTPKITWQKIIRDEDSITIPFTAIGKTGRKSYFGIYICEKEQVEYSLQ